MTYTVDHTDISIESSDTLSWAQRFDDALNYDNLYINSFDYTDYRPTKLQFHLTSATVSQTIKVKINYANRLTHTHAKHAVVCRYDVAKKQWTMVNHTINTQRKTLEFESSVIGVFTVFLNHYWYTEMTQRLADEYPNWTKIRQTKESTGQLFLNYFGMELESIQDYLTWIQEQKYIGTADTDTLDWVQMYQLPDVQLTDTLEILRAVGPSMVKVTILENLKEFFYNDLNQGGIVDYQESKFYTTQAYGNMVINITRKGSKTSHTITPMDYHIWNAFDEFGMMLGVSRLHVETNTVFKERILDVFRYPSGTHDLGLTHGIARDLSMIQRTDKFGKKLIWENDTKDFLLKNVSNKFIDVRTLRVDNQSLKESEYRQDELGNIYIYAKHERIPHDISFIYGIDKHELYDKTNTTLHKMMFQEDGQSTPTLLTWVEYINTVAPIMWDHFNWDDGFWDTIDQHLTGLGYLPNIWDSNIDIWKEYTFESER